MVNGGSDRCAMVPAGTLSAQDRATLLAYLTKQYGPASVRRGLRMDAEFPVDEAALGKAMYVEYYLPLDKQIDAGNKQRRTQQPHFDRDGNVGTPTAACRTASAASIRAPASSRTG